MNFRIFIPLLLLLFGCYKEVYVDLPEQEEKIAIYPEYDPDMVSFHIKKGVIVTDYSSSYRYRSDSNSFPAIKDAQFEIFDSRGNRFKLNHIGNGVYRNATMKFVEQENYRMSVSAGSKQFKANFTFPSKPKVKAGEGHVEEHYGTSYHFSNYVIDVDLQTPYYLIRAFSSTHLYRLSLYTNSIYVSGGGTNEYLYLPYLLLDLSKYRDQGVSINLGVDTEANYEMQVTTLPKSLFDYYKSIEQQQRTSGDPFAQPVEVKSNITPEGTGVFAYGNTGRYKHVIENSSPWPF